MPPLSCSGAFLSRLFYWSAAISLLKYRLRPPAHCSMASSHQCLHLFAEGSLWPPEPIKAMQGRLDVPKSLFPGNSPQPVTWEVVDKNPLPHSWVGILWRHVLHWSQCSPAEVSPNSCNLLKNIPCTGCLSFPVSCPHFLTSWDHLPNK